MSEPVLVVPVEVEALVVNNAVLRRDAFRWWQYNYLALKQFRSPEPEAGDRSVGGQTAGVYVSWTLPQGLRHGVQDPTTSEVSYPLVPNRWLVLRLSGGQPRHATGWVIESDCPFTSKVKQVGVERTSMYLPEAATIRAWKSSSDPYRSGVTLNPASTEPQVANIGVPFPVAAGWSERAASPMFLTAVAPGNPTLGAYAPHNLGVFTFIDDLKDLAPAGPQPLSYLVAGWYSDPAGDVLTSWQHENPTASAPDPYRALLDRLGWTVAGTPDGTKATRSLYRGSALAVAWDPTNAPAGDPLVEIRNTGQLQVSLGNTAEDAFITMIGKRLAAAGHPARTTAQLRAFLYGLLPLANQPNGDALVRRAIADQWFGAYSGGSHWAVTAADDADKAGSPRGPAAPDPAPPAWLDRLNADQRRLDLSVRALRAGQWDLNAMWWKRGRYPYDSFPTPPPGVDSGDLLDAQMDPSQSGSLAARVLALLQNVLTNTPTVPQPISAGTATPQDAFQKGVADYAAKHGLPADQTLKALPGDSYWQAADPVVMVSGVEATNEAGADPTVAVRPMSALVTALAAAGKVVNATHARAVLGSALAPFAGPPEIAQALADEFVLTDPGCAAALAAVVGVSPDAVAAAISAHRPADYTGVLPAVGLQAWSMPWRPLFAEWQVRYIDVPQTPGAAPWRFDGTDYVCAPGAGVGVSRTIGGLCLIGPHAPQVFRERLAEFVRQYGSDDDLAQLDSWIEDLSGWHFLSQELTGFGRLLAQRDQRGFRRPRPEEQIGTAHPQSLADVLGYPGAGTTPASLPDRYRGAVTSVPYLPAGTDVPFFGVRQGQIIFQQLVLYDRFGRVLPIILPGTQSGLYDPDNFPLIVDPALAPTATLDPRAAAPAQLPPRLLQPARLDFTLLDAATGADSVLTSAADPVGGWILPNHLDRALLLYAPDGTSLGELRTVAGPTGARSASWSPPAHSSISSPADVARLAPMVAALIGSPILTSATGFDLFLESIDSTLWTTDPLGGRADQNLSVLIGRPLALARARVRLELDGEPITDCGWAATLNPPRPGFLSQDFAVRLGDQATRDDGLIGYFAAGDLTVFNTVATPSTDPAGAAAAGLRPIGGTLPDGTANYLWRRCLPPSDPAAGTDPHEEVVLLLDPRGSVHATTGILPTRAVALPPALVSAALTRLEVAFRAGAALASIRASEVPAGQVPAFAESVAFPRPAENQGTWSWWQPGAAPAAWTGYGVADPGTGAALRPTANLLLDGLLQLVVDTTGESSTG
ncbi:hypothetical protein [Catenulispora rubra]|uniref:hypothetical protein n=1 Tax=Catenulispora rubra TaxID=280293 RepID=UPI0018920DD6|nr:hypothetical protein [Catenulispora rubra]